jgi:hypothetical protein
MLMKIVQAKQKLVICLLLAIGVGIALPPPQPLAADAGAAPIRIISSDASSVVIEFAMPDYALQETETDGQACLRAEAIGYTPLAEPGKPSLPQLAHMIGLPPSGGFSIHVLDAEQSSRAVALPLCPAPVPLVDRDALPDEPSYGVVTGYASVPDDTVYGRDALYPAEAATVAEVGNMRGQRIAQVTFSPLRYNPLQGRLEVTRRLLLEIRFLWEPSLQAASPTRQDSEAFDRLLQDTLINYDQAQNWQVAGTAAPLSFQAQALSSAYKVTVDRPGLYRVTYSDLAAAGLPVGSIDPASFELSTGNTPVSIRLQADGDTSFEPGESLLFYGYVPESRYTDYNIYWLSYGGSAQLMGTRAVTPQPADPNGVPWAVARYEVNARYDPACRGADGDRWFAVELRAADAPAFTAPLTLMPPLAGVSGAELNVGLVMKRGDQHHVTVRVNGTLVYDQSWTDADPYRNPYPYTATVTIDQALLHTGSNDVRVSTSGLNEVDWLDDIELTYAIQAADGDQVSFLGQSGAHDYTIGGFTGGPIELYDITDPDHPVQLTGAAGTTAGPQLAFSDSPPAPATYYALRTTQIQQPVSIVPDDVPAPTLHATTNGADYLVIAHSSFIDAIQPLVAHRQGEGLQVKVVDVQDVYDEFNGGLVSPEAIHDFISYAYWEWAVRPTYVLLVGDGSYDFLNHAGWDPPNYLPPYLQTVEFPLWGEQVEAAADNRYATVDGADAIADVFIGRLPVTSASEAATVAQKIVQYEDDPVPGNWNARHVFVIDYDEIDAFEQIMEPAYAHIAAPALKSVVDLDTFRLPDEVPLAQQQVLNAWNTGSLFYVYSGHSSWHQWSEWRLLHVSDVAAMGNGRRLPVMLSMTCYTGYFHHPEYATLDEEMLRHSGGGAVATWSPSELASGHEALLAGFYDAVYDGGLTELGAATAASKAALPGAYADLLDTYHLFGDPAMNLHLSHIEWPYSAYLPSAFKNYQGE